jgi:hypothetical protein
MGSNPHYTGASSSQNPDGHVIGGGAPARTDGGYPAATSHPEPKPELAPPPPDTSDWSDKPNNTWHHKVGSGVHVHRDKLHDVARALESDLNELQTVLQQVSTRCNVGRAHLGDWDAALQLGTTFENAYTAFTQYYADLTSGYQSVIRRLHKSAGIYADTEYSTEADVRGVQSGSNEDSRTQDSDTSWT